MHRVGGPVGCSIARIGSRTLLGLQEFAPQGQLTWTNVCNCWRHPKGVGFVGAALSDRKSNESILTQMSSALDGVSGRRKS